METNQKKALFTAVSEEESATVTGGLSIQDALKAIFLTQPSLPVAGTIASVQPDGSVVGTLGTGTSLLSFSFKLLG